MIVVYAGVQADEPTRSTPRLPIDVHEDLEARVRGLFQSLKPRLVIGALASGSDLIIAEAALAEGCTLRVYLPFDIATFRSTSVSTMGESWELRFDRLVQNSAVDVREGSLNEHENDVYLRHNGEMLDYSASLANPGERIWALVIRPTPDPSKPSVSDDFVARVTSRQLMNIDINPTAHKKRAFVAMGFGSKYDPVRRTTYDLDSVFRRIYQPVLESLNLAWTRADLEADSGVIHIGMIDSLANSDLVIADLATLNFNVAYEMGIRHALAPHSTVLVHPQIEGSPVPPPFDVNLIRNVTFDRAIDLTDEQAEEGIRQLLPVVENAIVSARSDSPVHDWFDLDSVARPHVQRRELAPILARELSLRGEVSHAILSSDAQAMVAVAGTVADEPGISEHARIGLRIQLASALIGEGNYAIATSLLEMARVDVESPLHRVWLQKLIMSYRRSAESEADPTAAADFYARAEGHIMVALGAGYEDSETYGIYGGFLKRKLTISTEIGSVAASAIFTQMREQYQHGFEIDPAFYTGVNLTMAIRLEMSRTGSDATTLEPLFDEVLVISKFLVRQAMKENPRDFWAAASHAELLLHEALGHGTSLDAATAAYASAGLLARPDHLHSAAHQLDFMLKWGDRPDSIDAVKSALLGIS